MTGYTIRLQLRQMAIQALNFRRPASAPVISAGVMIANIIWNAMKASLGMCVPGHSPLMLARPA
jgi:hypothetical protein